MARRRKDIKKRRKVKEEQQVSTASSELEEDLVEEQEESEEALDDDLILQADAPRREPAPEKVTPRPSGPTARDDTGKGGEALSSGWFGRNRENFLLGLLVLYVLLLGLGTVGELFETEWILNLPIFR